MDLDAGPPMQPPDPVRRRYVLEVGAIRGALLGDEVVSERLERDFGPLEPAGNEDLVDALLRALGQTPRLDPLAAPYETRRVFEAAVRAIGSNSRRWSAFISGLGELREVLSDFDPGAVASSVTAEDIEGFFPGQTRTRDARSVLAWARRLADPSRDFEQEFRKVGGAMQRLFQEHSREPLEDRTLMPLLAAFLGNPSEGWRGLAVHPDLREVDLKLPGMGPILASEFLRNLGWSGFKADRHVIRLLNRQVPDLVEAWRGPAGELATLVGRRDRPTLDGITYSLVGQDLTPQGLAYSHTDNLIWLLGAYVERKGHESDRRYVREV